VQMDLQVLSVALAHLDPREALECKVRRDLAGRRELQDPLDHLDLLEFRDPPVRLGRQEQSGTQVSKVRRVHPDLAGLSGQMDCQDQMVHRDHKARPVQLGPSVRAVHPVLKEMLDFRELREYQVHLELTGSQVVQDRRVLVEQTGNREL